jgi:hypothetical protein
MSGFDNTSETVRVITATTTATDNDYDIYAKGITGNILVNLPPVATTIPGRSYSITKDGAAFTVTIDANASETINGATTLVLAASAFHGAVIVNTGTEWVAKALY